MRSQMVLFKVKNLKNYHFDAIITLKLTTNDSFRGKQISNIRMFEAIILKQREYDQNNMFFDDFRTFSLFSIFIISGSECTCFS